MRSVTAPCPHQAVRDKERGVGSACTRSVERARSGVQFYLVGEAVRDIIGRDVGSACKRSRAASLIRRHCRTWLAERSEMASFSLNTGTTRATLSSSSVVSRRFTCASKSKAGLLVFACTHGSQPAGHSPALDVHDGMLATAPARTAHGCICKRAWNWSDAEAGIDPGNRQFRLSGVCAPTLKASSRKSRGVTSSCAACRSIMPNSVSYSAISPLCPADADARSACMAGAGHVTRNPQTGARGLRARQKMQAPCRLTAGCAQAAAAGHWDCLGCFAMPACSSTRACSSRCRASQHAGALRAGGALCMQVPCRQAAALSCTQEVQTTIIFIRCDVRRHAWMC